MLNHRVFDDLDAALAGVIPREPVDLRGALSTRPRRTYASLAQFGTGSGPYVDVVDLQWQGALTCATEIGAMVLMLNDGTLFWAKAPESSAELSILISLRAFTELAADRATYSVWLGGVTLPGVQVNVRESPFGPCARREGELTTGRVVRLAQADSSTVLAALLIQRRFLKFGRNRLWRLRDEISASLPGTVQAVLTRQRTGSIPK
jgi:hypothetical protein